MNQNHSSAFNTRRVARCALVAAVYVALCLGLAPFSFGAVQIRVAEILTLMPIFGRSTSRLSRWVVFFPTCWACPWA